jgi:hypothetical protein
MQPLVYESGIADAIAHFATRGYTGGFRAEGGDLREVVTGRVYRPEHLRIDALRRFEGESDPGDSAMVLALCSPEGEVRGTYVVAFGSGMDRLDAEAVRRLTDARPREAAAQRPAS